MMSTYEVLFWYHGKSDYEVNSVYVKVTLVANSESMAETLATAQLAGFTDNRYFQHVSTRVLDRG